MTKNCDWFKRSVESVWHPCTQMQHLNESPLLPISYGRGAWLFDMEGNGYLEVISSWWVNLLGHNNPLINQAIKLQLEKLAHVLLAGFTHQPVIELSEKLIQMTCYGDHKPFSHCLYASDGASATEIALKLAVHYWHNKSQCNKTKFIHLLNSYHGETVGALSVTDLAVFANPYSCLLPESMAAPCPDLHSMPLDLSEEVWIDFCLQSLKDKLDCCAESVAAMIVEPLVQGAAGMRMYSARYLTAAKKLCDEYNVLFIADEIAVGMGRTGTFCACEQANIKPDMLLLSKGLSGGYLPLSVVLVTEEIYDAFYDKSIGKGFLHSHSYTGNPLACAAALATLTIFENDDVINKNATRQLAWNACFEAIRGHELVSNWRQCGMIWAFDVELPSNSFPMIFSNIAKENCLILRPIGRTIYFMPPYILTDEDVNFLVSRTLSCLDQFKNIE